MQALENTLQVVVFALGDIEFGVDILQVREIERMRPITRVPHVAAYVEGVVNLRGRLVPVVDLRVRLGLPAKVPTKATRIIVAELGDRHIGMIVDQVREVARIPVNQIDDNEGILAGLAAEYVGGLARMDNRVIILLAVQNILSAGTVGADTVAAGTVEGPDKQSS